MKENFLVQELLGALRVNNFDNKKKMDRIMKKVSALLALAVMAYAAPASAGVITYTDRTAFQAAIAGNIITTDPFDNDIAKATSIVLDSGVTSKTIGGSPCCDDNSVGGGLYNNAVDADGTAGAHSVDWDFGKSIFAVGFDVIGANNGGLQIGIDDGAGAATWSVFSTIGGPDGFIGFLSDMSFSTLTFSNGSGSNDVFDLDNLVFAESRATDVPEPASLALFGIGLAGLGLARRKRAARRSDLTS